MVGASTEASELLELFRHVHDDEMDDVAMEQRGEIKAELGDILCILVRFAQYHDIGLAEAFQAKLEQNQEAYPVEQVKGLNQPKEELV